MLRAGSRLVQPTRQYAGVSYRGRAYYRGIIAEFTTTATCAVDARWICTHHHTTQAHANTCALRALRLAQEAQAS